MKRIDYLFTLLEEERNARIEKAVQAEYQSSLIERIDLDLEDMRKGA